MASVDKVEERSRITSEIDKLFCHCVGRMSADLQLPRGGLYKNNYYEKDI